MEDNSQNSSPNISGLPTNLTPMLVQYLELKRNHPDSILFYRMGDFYEMFFDDAIKAAPVLEVQLTSRDKNAVNPIPMCGVPYHAVSQYLQRLVARGFKVAICEQVEDPATAKGIVRREVTRVVTPALIGDPDMVSEESSNLLVSFFPEPDNIAVAILDLLSGTLRAGAVKTVEELVELFAANPPKEILIPESVESLSWYVEFRRYFPSTLVTYRSQFFTQRGKTSAVLNAVSQYLDETQKLTKLPFDTKPLPLSLAQGMQIDAVSAQALEIARSGNLEGGKTLFDVLNFTATPMGRRLLRDWLLNPLSQPKEINDRLDAVENLVEDAPLSEDLKALLGSIRDLERLTTKAALGLAMPRDLVSIRAILKLIPFIQTLLNRSKSKLLNRLSRELDPLSELTNLLDAALEDEPPATLRDGGIFRETYHPEIKECRSLSKDAKQTIAEIETRERERTGIPSLKIKFSRVFGYTIEITRNYLSKVPKEYHRKQTIANGERFITEELKRFEEKAMSAEQRVKSLEESLFLQVREKVGAKANPLHRNARLIGSVDALSSFARAAKDRGYTRPHLVSTGILKIEEGRHPVIETLLPPGQFVPNSITLSPEDCRTLIITGPNMGGKSTIMRQIALITLMTHAGSFVPAGGAHIPLTDAIFTRIGSSDDLTRGRSTFMVEMSEVGRILSKASTRSLILIDEIGRGTSTYDGLALAWSLVEHIHVNVKALTLFATHFHELTTLERNLPGLQNANVLVEKWKSEIVFLYRLAPGICNQSYGIEVARLAGLPVNVLDRARDILGLLEAHSQKGARQRSRALDIHENQLAFFEEIPPLENRSNIEN